MRKIIIFGLGQIAELTYDLIQQIQNLEVIAFTANKEHIHSDKYLNLPVYPIEESRIDQQGDDTCCRKKTSSTPLAR